MRKLLLTLAMLLAVVMGVEAAGKLTVGFVLD